MTVWYENAIIYAIDVARFYDSDGDGIGDLNGVLERLDYLVDLGVTCVWLLPFYRSPRRDNGYDVTDHCSVDRRLGTLEDFDRLVAALRGRGIRILIDFLANHTSDEHPWFQAARRDPNSQYRDYYHWRDEKPDTDEQSIFPTVEPDVWEWDETAGAYYYHKFYRFQPDLDTGNPAVEAELRKILDFWLRRGVDGFRIDAAPHVIDGIDGPPSRRAALLERLHEYALERDPEAALLGETDVKPGRLTFYFGRHGERLNLLLNFYLNNHLFLAFARQEANPLVIALTRLPVPPSGAAFVNFLRNLDELDLEQLSESEREQVYEVFAPDSDMRIYDRGIRRRLAPMFMGDTRRILLAFSLMLSLPGVPLIVYGDEIGMGEDLAQSGRDAVRIPMQWSDEPNGGFSTAVAGELVQPAVAAGGYGFQVINVAAQQNRDDSLLECVRALIALRRKHIPAGRDGFGLIDAGDPAVLAHRLGGRLRFVHNFAEGPRTVYMTLADAGGELIDLSSGEKVRISTGRAHIELGPYGHRWLRVA